MIAGHDEAPDLVAFDTRADRILAGTEERRQSLHPDPSVEGVVELDPVVGDQAVRRRDVDREREVRRRRRQARRQGGASDAVARDNGLLRPPADLHADPVVVERVVGDLARTEDAVAELDAAEAERQVH